HMIFLDEAGYTSTWTNGMDDQPYYVLSAVVVPADGLWSAYTELRRCENALQLPDAIIPLGLGREIKAREIATGAGWWRSHNEERNQIRDLMLSWPMPNRGIAILPV